MEETTALVEYQANVELPVLDLNHELQRVGLLAPKIPAKELVGRSFVINYAKPFMSSFKEQDHCYFIRATDPLTGEIFTTVLGGQAVVDILDMLRSTDFKNPLLVKLEFIKGGNYGGYYQFAMPDTDPENELPF